MAPQGQVILLQVNGAAAAAGTAVSHMQKQAHVDVSSGEVVLGHISPQQVKTNTVTTKMLINTTIDIQINENTTVDLRVIKDTTVTSRMKKNAIMCKSETRYPRVLTYLCLELRPVLN